MSIFSTTSALLSLFNTVTVTNYIICSTVNVIIVINYSRVTGSACQWLSVFLCVLKNNNNNNKVTAYGKNDFIIYLQVSKMLVLIIHSTLAHQWFKLCDFVCFTTINYLPDHIIMYK